MNDARPQLTERQADILACIVRRLRETGLPPSLREIGVDLGIKSPNAVMGHIRILREKGYLRPSQKYRRSRTYLPVVDDCVCPYCGQMVSPQSHMEAVTC